MDKVKILEIWKRDAIENGFTCEKCHNSMKSMLSDEKHFCIKNNTLTLPDHSCLDFEFKQIRDERT